MGLFWATNRGHLKPSYFTQIICLGFGKGSVRKFTVYDLTSTVKDYYSKNVEGMDGDEDDAKDANSDDNGGDEEEEEDEKKEDDDGMEMIGSVSFGVSNAIPIGHYDANHNLFFVSSIGDRKIRVYELSQRGIIEMNASFQSKGDVQGIAFALKQNVDVKKVEIGTCFKMTKDGVISPIPFCVPRKRKDFFQDDLYSDVLDTFQGGMDVDITKKGKLGMSVQWLSLKPDDMELLSKAPEEKTDRQKRRNSQIKAMDANKLKEQPKSTEQAFDQFSRMVADAPTANRWDAQNIGTEVDDDEWSD